MCKLEILTSLNNVKSLEKYLNESDIGTRNNKQVKPCMKENPIISKALFSLTGFSLINLLNYAH